MLKTISGILLSLEELKHTIMKRLLFVLAFTFIGQQAFSQMYIVTVSDDIDGVNCPHHILTIADPTGAQTYVCIENYVHNGALGQLNQELNNIASLGYKLVETSYFSANEGLIKIQSADWDELNDGVTFIFAIPWSASGLEEVPVNSTTLKSFIISPNPANTFVDISLDYSLKGESEVVFISEAGYISHKQSIGSISKNEKYNIDISKIPAGKYLVTIVNGKTYTTPQKLIIL